MQELYDLADKFAKENRVQSIDAPGNNYFELFHEKFAELIVRDCIRTLINNGYDDAAQCLQDTHFGIEHPV
jgi:hypothetical protein